MKKFAFTLQSVLGYKVTIEKRQKAELAEINAVIDGLNRQLSDIDSRRLHARESLDREKAEGGRILSLMQTYDRFFERLRDEKKIVTAKKQNAEMEKYQIQQRLIVTMKEIKSLESLKEDQFLRYQEEVRTEEAKELEDLLSHKKAD